MKTYGFDGVSGQRVTALVDGVRKTLCWGDDITAADISPFVEQPGYADVLIEAVADRDAEALAYPEYAGTA